MKIRDVIAKGEGQEIEFKETFHSTQEVGKVICAFANTQGGVLILGVKDDREIIGLNEDLDELQQRISAVSQSIESNPSITIEKHKIDHKNIIAVIIQRAIDSTYHTQRGVIYVRVGSTNRRLEGQAQLDYLRNRQILSFDESYDAIASLNDLDSEKIQNYLKSREQDDYLENHSLKDFLISAKLANQNKKLEIKNSTLLLFAKDPIHFHPQAEIKMVQFSGTEAVDIIAHKLIQADIVSSIRQAMAFIQSHISKEIQITNKEERNEVYEYPIDVIREALVNSVAHRDYFSKDAIQINIFDNRIEITNPGSLPQGLPEELFGSISVQRNPIIYRFLRDLKFVEGLGTGVPRMKNGMRKANLIDPEFVFSETIFRITLYNKKGKKTAIESERDLNPRQKKALEYLDKNKSIKTVTYASINNVSAVTATKDIKEMIEFGYIEKRGTFRGAYYIKK